MEPESSIPVKVTMRLQLNILLRKVEGIEYLFKNLQEVMYPVFWFEVKRLLLLNASRTQVVAVFNISLIFKSISELPESMAGPLNMLIFLPVIITVCGIFSIVCSVILILVLVVCSNINQKMALEEKAHNNKQLDIQYSKVPISDSGLSTSLCPT